MNKFAKILCIVLCAAILVGLVSAVAFASENETVGFVAADLGYENGAVVENIEGDLISFLFSDGGNSYGNCPKYYNTGSAIRFYAQNSLTISAAEGCEIISVTITTGSSNPMNADNTALTNAEASYTDTVTVLTPADGTEDIVMSYTKSSGHWRIVSIEVEYAGGMEEVTPPAGPVAVQLPGTLNYTFETDDAASIGVTFQWTATSDGELAVPRMIAGGAMYALVTINGGYDYEFGMNGYIVKAGDLVEITVYGNSAGAVDTYIDFVAAGNAGDAQLGTAQNPEIITSLNAGIEKTLTEGEYYYQYTAPKSGELIINTIGDGTHNLTVTVEGSYSMYSNWDYDGAYVKLNVNEGDVLTLMVNFDFGNGTINFNSDFDAGMTIDPTPGNPGTGDAIFAVLSLLSVSGMGIAVVASKKR